MPDRTTRLVGLARAWAKAKFFHPYLAYKDIDWDAALVAAIPKVEAATTIAAYRSAIDGMFAVLGDPVTRLDSSVAPLVVPAGAWLTTPAPGVLQIRVSALWRELDDEIGLVERAEEVEHAAAAAKVIELDLRGLGPRASLFGLAIELMANAFPAVDRWPRQRIVEHRGYRTQDGGALQDYESSFLTLGARAPRAASSLVSHVVVLVDASSVIPPVLLGLQAGGRVTIVAATALDERGAIQAISLPLPGGLQATIRMGELLWGAPVADEIVPDPKRLEARALAIAKAEIGAAARPRQVFERSLPSLQARDDLDYAAASYPSREHRLLAGIRMWAVFDTFSPYRSLAPHWDDALVEALPRLEAAADAVAYRLALRQMAAHSDDGHVSLWFDGRDPIVGGFDRIPVEVGVVEGKLAVIAVQEPVAAAAHGIAIGDVIETIDGRPAGDVLDEQRRTVAASNADSRDRWASSYTVRGGDGTPVTLGVRGADNQRREITLVRSSAIHAAAPDPRRPRWRRMPGNIGYVDLVALRVADIARMFDELSSARAIVFDLRGYPNVTMPVIAPRIHTRDAQIFAQFFRPRVIGAVFNSESEQFLLAGERRLQKIPSAPIDARTGVATALPRYRGKIVVLIDSRTMSQAEHGCLMFKAAAGATFVGSPTAGADGDITAMRLPGGLRMTFTGQEVRDADGHQLQQIGIVPDVLVRPTLTGMRAGKDEVLDRALAWLATGK